MLKTYKSTKGSMSLALSAYPFETLGKTSLTPLSFTKNCRSNATTLVAPRWKALYSSYMEGLIKMQVVKVMVRRNIVIPSRQKAHQHVSWSHSVWRGLNYLCQPKLSKETFARWGNVLLYHNNFPYIKLLAPRKVVWNELSFLWTWHKTPKIVHKKKQTSWKHIS